MKLPIAAAAFLILAGLPGIAAAAPAQVIDGTARLRAGPGTEFRILARVPEGTRVDLIKCLKDRSWCKVAVWDLRGWVHGSRLVVFRKRTDGRPGEVIGEVVDRPGYCYVLDENGNSVVMRCPDGVGADGEVTGGGKKGYVKILGIVVDKPGYCYALDYSGNSIIVKCP